MNETIKSSLIFVAGVAIGSAITFYTIKSKFEEKLKEQDEASKNFWKKYYEKNPPKKEDAEKPTTDISKNAAAEKAVKEAASIIPESTKQKEVYAPVNTSAVDYTKCFNTPVTNDKEPLTTNVSLAREPYEISEEKFEDLSPIYSRVVLHYFEEDDTYADHNNDPLIDDEAMYPDMLGRVPSTDASDKPVYFVLNELQGIAFKIYVMHNSYQNYIGG